MIREMLREPKTKNPDARFISFLLTLQKTYAYRAFSTLDLQRELEAVMNKDEYIQDVTKTVYQADHLYDEGLTVTVYGNAAVVTGIYRETGTTKGKSYTHRVRFTDTWIKQNGVWRCVASQSTLIQGK